jgi:threonine/homoserine/homoserine lactone efflux protein
VIYVGLGLLGVSVLLGACALWMAWRAWRSSEAARRGLIDANRGLRAELRGARLQLSNIIQLLLAAGFKKRRQGWEDDLDATQQRDTGDDMSWWRRR